MTTVHWPTVMKSTNEWVVWSGKGDKFFWMPACAGMTAPCSGLSAPTIAAGSGSNCQTSPFPLYPSILCSTPSLFHHSGSPFSWGQAPRSHPSFVIPAVAQRKAGIQNPSGIHAVVGEIGLPFSLEWRRHIIMAGIFICRADNSEFGCGSFQQR